jgi:hypothetical protein
MLNQVLFVEGELTLVGLAGLAEYSAFCWINPQSRRR